MIPCYNHAHFLSRAIRSALAQSYPRVEIVVVDDGSTDDTAAVAAGWGDRIRYVHQQNRGLAGARNAGIRASSGSLLFFLDADDEMLPDALSRMGAELDRAGVSFGLVACLPRLVQWIGSESHEVSLPPIPEGAPPEDIGWRTLAIGTRFPCTVLARREAFAACGEFDESYGRMGCEDRDMWLRMARRFRIRLLKERLVVTHYHGANMSGDPDRQLAGMMKLLRKARAMGEIPRWRLDFWGSLRSQLHYSASILHAEAGHPGRAWFHSLLSLALYPLPWREEMNARKEPWQRIRRFGAMSRDWLSRPAKRRHTQTRLPGSRPGDASRQPE